MTSARIIYCHCAYAQVVPPEVKQEVLRQLAESGTAFDAVADLCEMSARRDPGLKALAAEGGVKIAACYARAVRGLFIAADAPLPADGVEILNMRTDSAEQVIAALLTVGGKPIAPSANGAQILQEQK
ncbi:MAG TPA: hypothetical protein VFE47_10540 [Tepidisphaeraceae bacterium]|jgi:hypothetical protein|nr:hypothetical protein [Tepidisphaeraceae bacterium]